MKANKNDSVRKTGQSTHRPTPDEVSRATESLAAAENAIDSICSKGGQEFYNRYINGKLKRYSLTRQQLDFDNLVDITKVQGELGEKDYAMGVKGLT